MPEDPKREWILRVLGVEIGPAREGAGQAATQPASSVTIWSDAKEAADEQLNQLYAVLRKTGLPVLDQVAGEVEAVLARFRTGLVTALMNFDQAADGAKDRARLAALRVVDDYKARIPADPHVVAADTNPFGVRITLRATLGAALDTLSERLEAAA